MFWEVGAVDEWMLQLLTLPPDCRVDGTGFGIEP
jgi:hypothetical protein